jgi:hypothetical protein
MPVACHWQGLEQARQLLSDVERELTEAQGSATLDTRVTKERGWRQVRLLGLPRKSSQRSSCEPQHTPLGWGGVGWEMEAWWCVASPTHLSAPAHVNACVLVDACLPCTAQ